MLQNEFYSLSQLNVSDNKEEAKAIIKLNPKHDIFKGHFPDNPILPGVCTLQIIKEILAQICAKELFLSLGNNIKYLNLINPLQNEMIYLDYKIKYKENAVGASVSVYFESLKFCSFSGEFRFL